MPTVEMSELSLENEGEQWASLGDAKLADFVNNPTVMSVLSGKGLCLKEERIDSSLSQLRPFGNNSTDPFFIAFYRR